MISFAQNCEDVVLDRVFRSQAKGFYIDIGAWHPQIDSVTWHFYLNGWRGINVEPVRHYFEMLERARPNDVNLNIAIANTSADRAAFRVYPETGLSGLSSSIANELVSDPSFRGVEIEVLVRKLTDVCSQHVHGEIDFLKIDVEGSEKSTIESMDWKLFRPRVLVIEAITPVSHQPAWASWEYLLVEAGYVFAMYDGINRFYFREEEPALGQSLMAPANMLDGFMSRRERELQSKLEEAVQVRRAMDFELSRKAKELQHLRLLLAKTVIQ